LDIQFLKARFSYLALILLFSPCAGRAANATVGDTLPAFAGATFSDTTAHPAEATDVFSSITDSLPAAAADSLLQTVADSTATAADSLPVPRASSLDAPVFSKGRDSTIYDFTGDSRMIYYYGDVTVNYTNLEMKSDYMAYNVDSRTVFAVGTRDTLGKWVGRPVMKEDGKEYEMDTAYYNFASRKAQIKNVITAEGDGFLHGSVIKKMPDNSINVHNGKYTTCDAEHPHFYLRLTKAKVTPEPNSQTVFGPAYLVIEDVPVYLLGLPFGFIPKRNDRSGGFLFPTFGEEPSRGFYVTNIGWYFVFGEYFDLALTADYFTLGSFAVRANSRYKKMYRFDGTFSFNYNDNVSSSDESHSTQFSIDWSHRQDPKANPEISFNASVKYMSSSYRRYNSLANPQNALQSSAQSSISWARRWEGTPFNLSLNLTHSQNMQDSSYVLGLPNMTFSMSTIYPFKRKRRVGEERFYEKFSLSYNTTFDNKIRFKESELGAPNFWSKLENGMKHNFNIGLPSFNLLKYISISPSVNYGATMFFQGLQKSVDSTGRVTDIKSNSFSEFHLAHSYGFSVGASTRIYGMFQAGKNAYIQAFRHVMTPSLSLSYSPNLHHPANGWWYYYSVDNSGQPRTVDYNKYSGVYGAPGGKEAASLGFSLGNNFEMKVRNKADTTNGGVSKVKIIDNLNFSGSYNFLADSMRLSHIGVTLSTTILGVGVSANADLSPYRVVNGYEIDKLKMLRLTRFGFSFGYQMQGGENGIKNNPTTLDGIPRFDPETGEYLYTEYLFYNDFKAPWSFGFNYSFSYSEAAGQRAAQYMQSLNFNGTVKLTESFNLSANSGFDFKQMKLTTTSLNIHYDMHCFEFSVQWTPFGQYQSWSFRFSAKSSMLADLLKYDKRTNYYVY
jgi:lipopolysaccharide assembly outer membrane protein LptD (OstA)